MRSCFFNGSCGNGLLLFALLFHHDGDLRERLQHLEAAATTAGGEALHHDVLADPGFGDDEFVGPDAANAWSLTAGDAGTINAGATANFASFTGIGALCWLVSSVEGDTMGIHDPLGALDRQADVARAQEAGRAQAAGEAARGGAAPA